MRLRVLAIGCLALLAAAAAIAQTGTETKDPVSGKWGSDGLPYLELTFDGQRTVSGTTIWRRDDYVQRAAIKTGSFDVKTRALTLEGEVNGPDGVLRAYAIEGRIEGDTVSGTYKVGEDHGEFSFRRQ